MLLRLLEVQAEAIKYYCFPLPQPLSYSVPKAAPGIFRREVGRPAVSLGYCRVQFSMERMVQEKRWYVASPSSFGERQGAQQRFWFFPFAPL